MPRFLKVETGLSEPLDGLLYLAEGLLGVEAVHQRAGQAACQTLNNAFSALDSTIREMQSLVEAYERAVAEERAAFAAVLDAQPNSADYAKSFQRWEQAIRSAKEARAAMLRGLRPGQPGLESGGTG